VALTPESGSLAGWCDGTVRPFELVWDELAAGYRRRFPRSSWTWDEARVWTPAEALQKLRAREWRPRTAGP